MDRHVYKSWWQDVLLLGVRERHGGAQWVLIMDNSATHHIELTALDADVLFLPPNTTAVYQPMDAGVIAALKRLCKRRLLAIIVRSLHDE